MGANSRYYHTITDIAENITHNAVDNDSYRIYGAMRVRVQL